MRQKLEMRTENKFSLKRNLGTITISAEIIIVAAVILIYIKAPLTTKMEHCQSCSVTISKPDSSVYILNGGDVLCITKTGSFSGRILRWTGSQELLICNEGKILSKNIQLNAGINKINNYGLFQPTLFQVYPGTKQNVIRNFQKAVFKPKYLHLLNNNNQLDQQSDQLHHLSLSSFNETLRKFGNPAKESPSLKLPRISCWPNTSMNSFDFSLPIAWSQHIKTISLERSEDGIQFYSVNSQKSIPSSHLSSHQIHIQDQNPVPGSSFYRLRINNIENKVLFSPMISISWIPEEYFSSLTSSLHSSKTTFYIHTDIKLVGSIGIYDYQGKEYARMDYQLSQGANQILLDLGSLPSGVYWAGFESEEIEVYYPYVKFRRT